MSLKTDRFIISAPINMTAREISRLNGWLCFKLLCWENNPNQTTSCGNDYRNTLWCRKNLNDLKVIQNEKSATMTVNIRGIQFNQLVMKLEIIWRSPEHLQPHPVHT